MHFSVKQKQCVMKFILHIVRYTQKFVLENNEFSLIIFYSMSYYGMHTSHHPRGINVITNSDWLVHKSVRIGQCRPL